MTTRRNHYRPLAMALDGDTDGPDDDGDDSDDVNAATTPAPPIDPSTVAPVDPSALDPQTYGAIIQLLGLDDTATPADVLNAVQDLANGEAAAAGKPSAVAASARRLGFALLDAEQVAKLRRDAVEGQRVVAKVAEERREHVVFAAVKRGAITAGRRKHWLALLAADPEMEKVLASTPSNTAVPISELGHSAAIDGWEDPANLAAYDPKAPYGAGRWVK